MVVPADSNECAGASREINKMHLSLTSAVHKASSREAAPKTASQGGRRVERKPRRRVSTGAFLVVGVVGFELAPEPLEVLAPHPRVCLVDDGPALRSVEIAKVSDAVEVIP